MAGVLTSLVQARSVVGAVTVHIALRLAFDALWRALG
jgi:hypothetical protein